MLKLKRARIRRFKSIWELEIGLAANLLVLIGQNGAGKSSTLQAFALLREFARGKVASFFDARGWDPMDVRHRGRTSVPSIIGYDLVLEAPDGARFLWEIDWGLSSGRTRREMIWRVSDGNWTRLVDYRFPGLLRPNRPSPFRGLRLSGSILNAVDPEEISPEIDLAPLQQWASGIVSLELLSPHAMRRGIRTHATDLGDRGERLAGFLAGLPAESRARIVDRLKRYYPLEGLTTVRKRAGWIDLSIAEAISGVSVKAEHVSDGFLRLLAICTIPELGPSASLVLLDEIEDGIEPHILPDVVRDLREESSS